MAVKLWILLGLALVKCRADSVPDLCIESYKPPFERYLKGVMGQHDAANFMKNPVDECRIMNSSIFHISCNFYKDTKKCIESCPKEITKSTEVVLFPFKIICVDQFEDYVMYFDDCKNPSNCTRCGHSSACGRYTDSFYKLLSFANQALERKDLKEACEFMNCRIKSSRNVADLHEKEVAKLQVSTMKKLAISAVTEVTEQEEGLKPLPKTCQDMINPPPETTTASPVPTATTDGTGTTCPISVWVTLCGIIFGMIFKEN